MFWNLKSKDQWAPKIIKYLRGKYLQQIFTCSKSTVKHEMGVKYV